MKINQITFRNFKGFSGKFDLGAVTLITGANFRHKTSIPLAIRLALSGKLPPPIGVQGIYSLAGNPDQQGSMSIELLLDEKRSVSWQWTKDSKGKVTVDGGISPDLAMPELLMEPRLFFQKTAAERIKTIFAACNLADETDMPKIISSRLSEVQVPPVAVCEPTLDEIRQKIRTLPAEPAQAFTGMLLDWLKFSQKEASDASKTAQGAFAAFKPSDGSERPTDVTNDLQVAREKLAQLKAEHRNWDNPLLGDRKLAIGRQLNELPRILPEDIKGFQSITNNPPTDPEEMDDDLPNLIQGLKKAEEGHLTAITEIKSLEERIKYLDNSDACPMCGAKKKGWKEIALVDLRKQHAEHDQKRAAAAVAIESIARTIADIKIYKAAVEKLAQHEATAVKEKELRAELKQIDANLVQPDSTLPGRIQQQEQTVRTLEGQQRAWDTYKQDVGRREVLERDMLAAQCKTEVFKAVCKIVSEEQNKLIEGAFTQVLRVAKHFTDGLLNSPLEFTKGELGRRVSKQDKDQGNLAPIGSWISHEVFSGTEELLAYAGFSVALAADAPVKVVMLDELGRLDPTRKVDITQRMLHLSEIGVIDQAILVDVSDKDYRGLMAQKNLKAINL